MPLAFAYPSVEVESGTGRRSIERSVTFGSTVRSAGAALNGGGQRHRRVERQDRHIQGRVRLPRRQRR